MDINRDWNIEPSQVGAANLRIVSLFEWPDRERRRSCLPISLRFRKYWRPWDDSWEACGRGRGKEGFVVPQGLFLLTSLTGRRLLASFSIILERRRWAPSQSTCIDAAADTKNGAKNWNYSSIFPRNALITPRRFLEVSWNTVIIL